MRATFTSGLVRQLVIHEADQNQEILVVPSVCVVEKLTDHFSQIVGREGFRMITARAVKITARIFPDMSSIQLGEDGRLIGMTEALAQDPQTTEALLENIFTLVTTLIGEDMTLRIVCTIWPEFEWTDADGQETEIP